MFVKCAARLQSARVICIPSHGRGWSLVLSIQALCEKFQVLEHKFQFFWLRKQDYLVTLHLNKVCCLIWLIHILLLWLLHSVVCDNIHSLQYILNCPNIATSTGGVIWLLWGESRINLHSFGGPSFSRSNARAICDHHLKRIIVNALLSPDMTGKVVGQIVFKNCTDWSTTFNHPP